MASYLQHRRNSVSVCFPAYNEAATVQAVVREADELLAQLDIDYEIIVCNDGSTDSTGLELERVAIDLPHVRVLYNVQNRGIRATFERLYAEAEKNLVFLNSMDGQWPTSVLLELLPMTSNWDIVIASRRDKHYGWFRELVSWTFNALPQVLFGVSTYDAGAVKLARREILQSIPVISRSPFSEAERLVKASLAGYKICQVQVDTAPRRAGRSNAMRRGVLWLAIKDVALVWWQLRFQHSRHDYRSVATVQSVSPHKTFITVHGRRLVRFGAVGLSGVVVNNAILLLLVERVGWNPVVASVVATEVAILNNFALNDRWTFADSPRPRGWRARLASYNLLTLGGLLISVAVLAAMTYLGHVHYLVANLFAIGAGTAWNYLSNHGWTWSMHLRTGAPKSIDGSLSGETAH